MDEQPNLDETKADIARATGAAVGKVALGALLASALGAPTIGAAVVEIVGTLIPNWRVEHLKEFVEILDEKLKDLETDVRDQKMKTPEFGDLFEDALWQAARALTRERKEKIAAFLKYSLYHGELDHIQEKRLLAILNELNAVHIIMLKYDAFHTKSDAQREYYERHREVLLPPFHGLSASDEDIDRFALHRPYRNDLLRMGLVQVTFQQPKKNEMPEIDPKTGILKEQSRRLTRLGRLLLRYIELDEAAGGVAEDL